VFDGSGVDADMRAARMRKGVGPIAGKRGFHKGLEVQASGTRLRLSPAETIAKLHPGYPSKQRMAPSGRLRPNPRASHPRLLRTNIVVKIIGGG
jgi:hypothetical protein